MKKLVTALAVTLIVSGGFTVLVSSAGADPPTGGPPGQGDCSHGNSGASCVPDPQPSHGQDCDEHGPFEGGVNEDHCLSVTPTTPPPTTPPPTTPPPTTPPPTTQPPTTPPPTTVPPTTPPPRETPTTAPTTPPVVQSPKHHHNKNMKPKGQTVTPSPELAFTGISEQQKVGWMLLLLGLGLFFVGPVAWRIQRKDST